MDRERFDNVARAIARRASRRHILLGIVGGGAAAMLTGKAQAAPGECNVGCSGLSGPAKAACKQVCRECGGDFQQLCPTFGPFGPVSFVCCGEGEFCTESGFCEAPVTP